MALDIESWLGRLPLADEERTDGLVLIGRLPEIADGVFHLVAAETRLSFSSGDLLALIDAAEDEPGHLLPPGSVRVAIRRGAALLDARPCSVAGKSAPRTPFAFSTRPQILRLGPSPGFREREREFLERHSLTRT